jgi:hypothetical protein
LLSYDRKWLEAYGGSGAMRQHARTTDDAEIRRLRFVGKHWFDLKTILSKPANNDPEYRDAIHAIHRNTLRNRSGHEHGAGRIAPGIGGAFV